MTYAVDGFARGQRVPQIDEQVDDAPADHPEVVSPHKYHPRNAHFDGQKEERACCVGITK